MYRYILPTGSFFLFCAEVAFLGVHSKSWGLRRKRFRRKEKKKKNLKSYKGREIHGSAADEALTMAGYENLP